MLKKKICANFQRIIELFAQKIVTKLSKVWVWDPGSGKNLFRIPDPGVKKAPATLVVKGTKSTEVSNRSHRMKQCCGSRCASFWASWIRIGHYFIYLYGSGSFHQQLIKSKKKPWFLLLCDFFLLLFIFGDCTFKSNMQKKLSKKIIFLADILKATNEKSRIR